MLQEHAEHLKDPPLRDATYEILVDYDADCGDPTAQFTTGQLEYAKLQCAALHWFLWSLAKYQTGESNGKTAQECAQEASEHVLDRVSARTIMNWYRDNYRANGGLLVPRQSD